jgi:hypothetical protein
MERSTVLRFLKIANTVAFLGTITVNVLANALPINGKTTGELSDLYPNLFVPAGFTFSIWGMIYLLLAMFIVYQIAIPNRSETGFVEKIDFYFILASAANVGWIFLWHHEKVTLSLAAMLVLLASLLVIYLRLGIGVKAATWRERLVVQIPFSVYLGWITVATIANVTAVLVHIQWNRFGATETIWTVVVLIIAVLITLAVLFTRNDIFYALVILWAFFGILFKRLAVDSPPNRSIVITLGIAMAAVGVALLLRIPRWLRAPV